jgi:hypothetical protein
MKEDRVGIQWASISESGIRTSGPIEKIQAKLSEIAAKGKKWMEAQPAPVEIGLVTGLNSVQGAFIGGLMGNLTGDISQQMAGSEGQIPKEKLDGMKALAGGPWVQAKNFAVMSGVNAGLACAMKRYRKGKEDMFNTLVPAFGSGAAYAVVTGIGADQPGGMFASALSSGAGFAVFQGALVQVGKKFSPKPETDLEYLHTRQLLNDLGLERYEKNLRRGQLTDRTLPLLTDSALKDVQVPPGPRLLILEAVHRRRQESVPRRPVLKTLVKA